MTDQILTEPPVDAEPTAIDELVRRACSLYTLPAVAAEVIQLTNNPKVDARALKECIQADPALTAKILRVVNSSLFGLSREVTDLNQALALLGTKPLKLLVLGFSLPENLFAEVARDQLDWYWSTTLARAVAAREISEQLFDRPGDDAFLAGLLQDIGVLVLLGEVKEPYAKFLSGVIEQRVDLRGLEVDSLGFDHLQLTAALLEHWNMPTLLVEAIATERNSTQLAKRTDENATLAKVVHLAELVAELVGQNRLGVLPDLMEAGAAYCELDKDQLNSLVGTLQPKVRQLADVLSLEVADENDAKVDYLETIAAAHQQMSQLTEEFVQQLGQQPHEDDQAYLSLVADANSLRETVDTFLQPAAELSLVESGNDESGADLSAEAPAQRTSNAEPVATTADFQTRLTLAIGNCRARRQPVSLVVLEISGDSADDSQTAPVVSQLLDMTVRVVEVPDKICESPTATRRVLVLPGLDRHEAVQHADEALDRADKLLSRLGEKGTPLDCHANAGVSSVALPPKNFPPHDLIDTAERCLAAAQSTGAYVVKSLEIY